jgi:hypothetical protein
LRPFYELMPDGSIGRPGDSEVEGHELGDRSQVWLDAYRVSAEDVEPGGGPCSGRAANGDGEEGWTSLGRGWAWTRKESIESVCKYGKGGCR